MVNLLNDEDELEQAASDARNKKLWLNAAGGITDALTNVRSASEIALGQGRPQNRFGDSFRAAAENVENPIDQKSKAFAYMKAKRENAEASDKELFRNTLKDDASPAAMAFKQSLISSGGDPAAIKGARAIDLYNQGFSPAKMAEIKSQSNIDFGNKKELARIEHGYDMEKERTKNNSPKGQFDRLPEDKKLTITELAKKNANKTSIKNQIDAVMSNWDSWDDDQRLTQGRQLLKTLNSPEGADAVGAEEAKRLGSKLEFAMGNFTNSNPTQFGRDLPGFAQQARDTAQNIGSGVQLNQAIIDEAYGRTPAPRAGGNKTPQELAMEEIQRRNAFKNTASK